jgi:hypothetical protein
MITINISKAKLVGHDLRRQAREAEFKPLDEIIMKQIPGKDHTEAEAQRQAIRDKYSVIQTQIDAATSVDEIKTALGV